MWRTTLPCLGLLACHLAQPAVAGDVPLSRSAPATANVRGQVLLTQQTYCGGARPREGMQLSHQGPWAGKRFLLRPGAQNTAGTPVVELVTDSDGRFALSLPAGQYCLVREEKRELTPPPDTDKNLMDVHCLEEQQRTCDAVVDVPEHQEIQVPVEIYLPCFGSCYSGPFPP